MTTDLSEAIDPHVAMDRPAGSGLRAAIRMVGQSGVGPERRHVLIGHRVAAVPRVQARARVRAPEPEPAPAAVPPGAANLGHRPVTVRSGLTIRGVTGSWIGPTVHYYPESSYRNCPRVSAGISSTLP